MELTSLQRFLFVVAVLILAFADGIASLPEPDPAITFDCPNYDSIKVHRVDWATRSNVYVKTIPATCNDTTAVSPGYLR